MGSKLHSRRKMLIEAQAAYRAAYGLISDEEAEESPMSSGSRRCRIGLVSELYDLRAQARTARARSQIDADLISAIAGLESAMAEFDRTYGLYLAMCDVAGVEHVEVGHDLCPCSVCTDNVERLTRMARHAA